MACHSLTLICGIPNAGKTTYALRYNNVIHLDDMPHKGGQFKNCDALARDTNGDVVVEGVYVTTKHRRGLLEACRDKSPKICIWLDTPLEECLEREKKYRRRPFNIVSGHHDMLEQPTLDEGWDEIIIIKGG